MKAETRPEATVPPRGLRAARGRPRLWLAATVAAAALSLSAGCGGSERTGETISFTIPSGTTQLIERGGTSDAIPEKITGRVGDTLVVKNRDEATQFIAGYSVSPGQTLRIPLNRSGSWVTDCSAHRDRSIRMEISE